MQFKKSSSLLTPFGRRFKSEPPTKGRALADSNTLKVKFNDNHTLEASFKKESQTLMKLCEGKVSYGARAGI
ncbi:protein of unknown function [Thermococcus camini]|uniref:Uncharacterized protein n=1 Tax=Thermococcus camini TaxID=2016373 RepID=A0A7G2D9M3_9EURY|nr:protein of unknown function [Thermococcus camini]